MTFYEVSAPSRVRDMESCETCGHYSTFEAGFEVDPAGGYVTGWYENMVSCYSWTIYDPEDEDTLDTFREFLEEVGQAESEELLAKLERVFGK